MRVVNVPVFVVTLLVLLAVARALYTTVYERGFEDGKAECIEVEYPIKDSMLYGERVLVCDAETVRDLIFIAHDEGQGVEGGA